MIPSLASPPTLLLAADGAPDPSRELEYACALEEGHVLVFSRTPFALPAEDRALLLAQASSDLGTHKHVAYHPTGDRITGLPVEAPDAEAVRRVLRDYSGRVVRFAAAQFPGYARRWRVDYASFRPHEEAGRRLPLHARNDLVHVDAFPSRPTGGDRLLRIFTNIHPTAPRVWLTGGTFEELAARFAGSPGLEGRRGRGSLRRMVRRVAGLAGLPVTARSAYDEFMLRFHDFLKENTAYQGEESKRRLVFPAGSTWLVFTDMVSHAVLSGQYALEHTFVVARETLARPEKAPIAILERLPRRR